MSESRKKGKQKRKRRGKKHKKKKKSSSPFDFEAAMVEITKCKPFEAELSGTQKHAVFADRAKECAIKRRELHEDNQSRLARRRAKESKEK